MSTDLTSTQVSYIYTTVFRVERFNNRMRNREIVYSFIRGINDL
jgi:hypothetical protein